MARDIKVFDAHELTERVAVVLGTRPGIIMLAPVIKALQTRKVPHTVIQTGQHYSPAMDADMFHDLELTSPAHRLEGVAERHTHGGQTAAMLEGIERVLMEERPSVVLVGGDANTNLAGALAARKLRMRLGHVEAGERSFDWRMPEEHNRRIIDHISDYLFATGEVARQNLLRESVQGEIHVVGNTIVDASLQHFELTRTKSNALAEHFVQPGAYAVLTMHREENVDFEANLRGALQGVSQACERLGLPVLFLVHPRTRKRLQEFKLSDWAAGLPALRLHEAVGYLDFLKLLAHARVVFTDSGGVQQEACIHHVPTVTLRENTEWIETLQQGANRLAGTDPVRIVNAAAEADSVSREWPVPFGDGTAAQQVVNVACQALEAART